MEIGTADGTGRTRKTPRFTGRASGVTCTRLLGRPGKAADVKGREAPSAMSVIEDLWVYAISLVLFVIYQRLQLLFGLSC